ncbi:thioesterase domain-containing protein [Spirillospora sp. NPDC047418]
MDAGEPLPASVEEAARDHVTHLRTVQRHGPYHLAGYSLGGRGGRFAVLHRPRRPHGRIADGRGQLFRHAEFRVNTPA